MLQAGMKNANIKRCVVYASLRQLPLVHFTVEPPPNTATLPLPTVIDRLQC